MEDSTTLLMEIISKQDQILERLDCELVSVPEASKRLKGITEGRLKKLIESGRVRAVLTANTKRKHYKVNVSQVINDLQSIESFKHR
jgi:hypothetical protein